MVARSELERAVRSAGTAGERIASFGALLSSATGLGRRLVVVGGSAISVYSRGEYVSEGIDVVGDGARIARTLRRWGFHPTEKGPRTYWAREDLGLLVDVIDRPDYVGLNEGIRTGSTPYGPVRLAAVEDLIVRRLVFAMRERDPEFLDEAVLLWLRFAEDLDHDYLAHHVRFEGVGAAFRQLQRRASAVAARPLRAVGGDRARAPRTVRSAITARARPRAGRARRR